MLSTRSLVAAGRPGSALKSWLSVSLCLAIASFATEALAEQRDTALEEDDYFASTQHLSIEDIEALTDGLTLEDLIERFGRPLGGNVPAAGWPKEGHEELSDTDQWAKGWWFVFKKKANGRLAQPKQLEYVASLKNGETEGMALLDLFPQMTIDWPGSAKGKTLRETYFADFFEPRNA